jgi:hypothetical protein
MRMKTSEPDPPGDEMGLSEKVVERRKPADDSPRFRFSGVIQLGQVIQFAGVIGTCVWLAYAVGDWHASYDAKLANSSTRLTEAEVKLNRMDETLRALAAYESKFTAITQRFVTDEAAVAQMGARADAFQTEIRGKLDKIGDKIDTFSERLPRVGGR